MNVIVHVVPYQHKQHAPDHENVEEELVGLPAILEIVVDYAKLLVKLDALVY